MGDAASAKITGPPAAPASGAPDIPGYRLGEVLGEGAMGTVYAAEQQAPRRPVAIKVLHALSPSALVRFRAEAEIMARLDHAGIPIAPDRLAVVLEDGAIVIEALGPHTLDELSRVLGGATTYRLPAVR
jgi:serine/threonine protein kinase